MNLFPSEPDWFSMIAGLATIGSVAYNIVQGLRNAKLTKQIKILEVKLSKNKIEQSENEVDGDIVAGNVYEADLQEVNRLSSRENEVKQIKNKVKGNLIGGNKLTNNKSE